MKKLFVFSVLFFFILVGGFFSYKLYALHSMHAETVVLKQFSVNEKLQPRITLEFSVVNPSFVDNTIEQIVYRAYLVDYNEELFSGVLTGQLVPAHNHAAFVLDESLSWKPDIAMILDMLQRDKIMVEFSTLTTVDYFGFPITSEKTATFDIAASVKPVLQQQVNSLKGLLKGLMQ